MVAYYILRPIRDAMASDWTDTELSVVWNLNFFVSVRHRRVCTVSPYRPGSLSRWLVPGVYAILRGSASSLSIFGIEYRWRNGKLLDKTFYLWVSVFSLFHVSVFWSFMSDLFNEGAGRPAVRVHRRGRQRRSAGSGRWFTALLFAQVLGTDQVAVTGRSD